MKQSLQIGDIEIFWLNGGEFELDGGTMFGAVPKVLWSKRFPADDENYIKLLNAPLLVRAADKLVIIDSGLGNKFSDKQKKIFRVTREWSLEDDLSALGLCREDIDTVVLTHCDFDHAGGIVMSGLEGSPELTFPNAVHYIQEKEWHDVQNPNIRATHTYWEENFQGLERSGKLTLVSGSCEVAPGVTVELTGGHTRGHQIVRIESGNQRAIHLADLLPTHVHTSPLWIMAYDNFPLEVIELKRRIMKEAVESDSWFTFYHDPFMMACKLDVNGKVVESFQPAE
jgi:glyoxylase-like metal-dependent hydrolase (beta-lactamase superfamily II)